MMKIAKTGFLVTNSFMYACLKKFLYITLLVTMFLSFSQDKGFHSPSNSDQVHFLKV